MPTGQTGGQTDGRQTVTLSFPLDFVGVTIQMAAITTPVEKIS